MTQCRGAACTWYFQQSWWTPWMGDGDVNSLEGVGFMVEAFKMHAKPHDSGRGKMFSCPLN